ncbi:hypothetical protein ARMGADRAFT_897903, partial [Armillaria gallica]
WKDPEGLQTIKIIVTKCIKAWKDGLHPFQEQPIIYILNSEDVLLGTVTGNGKSALFSIPILCHLELSQYPEEYPLLPAHKHPVG